jgi:hypothetical protein
VDVLLFAPFVFLLPPLMEQYLSGAAKLQDSQQPVGAGANSRLSLKLLIGRERRTGRELAHTLEHSFPLFLDRSRQGLAHAKGGCGAPGR